VSRALPNTVVAAAPAKINLFLRVLGRRPDGYHDLETVVLPISLEDRLEIHAYAGEDEFRTLSVSLDVSGEPSVVRGVPRDESNLVVRAALALAEVAEVRGFADMRLEKHVPPAAGLGGGSADAAATLRALNDLWGCGLDDRDLAQVGATVGSDVPALLTGGPVLVTGRGERVEPVPAPELRWVLVTFGFGVRTSDAFSWWDEEVDATGPGPRPLVDGLAASADRGGPGLDLTVDLPFNDLEGPVIRRHPEVGRVKEVLRTAGAEAVLMSGSGPTVAALLPPGAKLPEEAEAEAARVSGGKVMRIRSRSGGNEALPPAMDVG
jgi:4-diphosphocytidyl-2-C-methyl-D-erythritol kinase